MIVIDTSILIDSLFEKDKERNKEATEFLRSIEGLTVIIPKILLIELVSVTRRLGIGITTRDLEDLVTDFEAMPEVSLFNEALKVAEKRHSRAVDSYFIDVAKLSGAFLVSSDKRMVDEGKEYGIQAYYLPSEFREALKATQELKRGSR
jgi:hypothetical protein